MKNACYLSVALLIASAISMGHAENIKPDPNISGLYTHNDKICEVGREPSKEMTWVNCQKIDSTLKIKKKIIKIDGIDRVYVNYTIDAKIYFANFHQCTFHSENGMWVRDRLRAGSDSDWVKNCQLSVFFFDGAAHVIGSDACQQLCGARGSFDQVVLKNKR